MGLYVKGWFRRMFVDLLLPWIYRLVRLCWPRIRLFRRVFVVRFDAVQEILSRPAEFVVPYGAKAAELRWSPQFLLGIEHVHGDDYRRMHALVRQLWSSGDEAVVAGIVRETVREALSKPGEVDAMQSMVVASAVNVVERYYGVPIPDERRSAVIRAANEILAYLFQWPERHDTDRRDTKKTRDAETLHAVIREAMQTPRPGGATSVLDRGVSAGVADDQLHSCLMGMISGFLPAFTNGAGRALHGILRRDVACLAMRRAVALQDDAGILTLCYEALRFRYVLPWLWRKALVDATIGKGTDSEFQVRNGDMIAMSPISAMQDSRRVMLPREFLAGRSRDLYLVYGYAYHDCIGRWIADVMLREICIGLFAADARRSGRTKWKGMVPERIPIEHGPRSPGRAA